MAIITKAEFEDRFTSEERTAIRDMRGGVTDVWLILFDMAETIDTSYAGFRHALTWIAEQGAFDPERIDEVLA